MVSINIPEANWAARLGYSPGKTCADPGWPGPRRAAAIAASAPVVPSRAAFAATRAWSWETCRHSAAISRRL